MRPPPAVLRAHLGGRAEPFFYAYVFHIKGLKKKDGVKRLEKAATRRLDLQELEGHPVLLSLHDAARSHCAGTLFSVTADTLLVKLDNQPWEPVHHTGALVSISSAERVVRFQVTCDQVPDSSDVIRCTTPRQLEVLERRRHPRANVSAHLQYWTDAGAEPLPVSAQTVDLGPGGLSFQSPHAPPIGAGVWVRFATPPLTSLGQLPGRVLRVHRDQAGPCRVAIGFWYLHEEAESQLAQVVEWERWIAAGRTL